MKSTQVLVSAIMTVFAVSCFPQNSAEFIAQNDDFVNYNKWTFVDKVSGNSDLTQGAHLSDNPNTNRTIYVKDNADRTDNGKFPIGATLVKVYADKASTLLGGTAMVKRGAGFNKAGGGWEYFVLDLKSGKIALDPSGAQIRGAITKCIECHAKTAENDHVFTR